MAAFFYGLGLWPLALSVVLVLWFVSMTNAQSLRSEIQDLKKTKDQRPKTEDPDN